MSIRSRLSSSVAVLATSLALAGCAPFSGFDDNNAIIEGNSFNSTMSSSMSTPSQFDFSCGTCNGVKRVRNITVPENPVFSMTLTIGSGRFKAVLVRDNSVYTITDAPTQGMVRTSIPAGDYNLRIVAENAKFNLHLDLNTFGG